MEDATRLSACAASHHLCSPRQYQALLFVRISHFSRLKTSGLSILVAATGVAVDRTERYPLCRRQVCPS